jgi:hypothetical protein
MYVFPFLYEIHDEQPGYELHSRYEAGARDDE